MNTSHTPGPWHVGSGDGRAVFTGKHAKPIVAPNQADARLIAAAPELLALLQSAIYVEDNRHLPGFGDVSLGHLSTAIRAALAKVISEV